jgi:hypothetical protein
MKKTNSTPINQTALHKLTKQLWGQDGQPVNRHLDFFWKIEQQLLMANISYGSGVSNSLASRIER